MRLLYLDWPHLPFRIEATRESLPELVVIGGQPWEKGSVLDCSPAARRLGVRRGQPLGSAHTLVPEARFLAADTAGYRQAMEAVLEALADFTPALEGEADPGGDRFGQLMLGIEGLYRLWGDELALAGRVVRAARRFLPGSPRVGIGNTRFGAQVAAVVGVAHGTQREGRDGEPPAEAIPMGDASAEAAYLAGLPIRLLPADDETAERLRIFGLATIGQLAAISRSAVVARFGERGGVLHDLCRGLDGRPLRPRRPVEHLRAEAELDPPVEEIEPLRFVLRHLCGALCEQLAARGAGAGRATLVLELEGAAPLTLTQVLPEPVALPELIERLLLARLSATLPTAPVSRLTLELDGTAPAAGQQLGLFAPQLARAGRLDWQLAGLAIRFGADRLLRARILDPEATLPERRSEWIPLTAEPIQR
ncbi:DNA polymerase IV [soil metagenome]